VAAGGYDLIVLGGGASGLTAARTARRLGARVLLAEADRIGGECTWEGCVPSKALLHAAGVAHQLRTAGTLGVRTSAIEVDIARVMACVRAAAERVSAFESADVLRTEGIEVAMTRARFLDPRTIEIDGRRLTARRFVVCTGAGPAIPPIAGLSESPHLTYESVFELDHLPATLIVLGAGPVGVELAQAFVRLGSRVVLVERLERVLAVADPEASAALAERLRAEGVTLRLGAVVERVEPAGPGVALILGTERVQGDALLVATGKRPRLAGLDLERAGIEHGPEGIRVDERLRTTQAGIYAAGDVTGGPQFTHYAGWQGYVAARNALLPGANRRGRRSAVPWAVFTDPEVAQVGAAEAQARSRGREVIVHRLRLERVDRAQTVNATDGFIKVLAGPDGHLLGAVIVGPAAGELANELSVALEAGLRPPDLARAIHVYPTFGSGIQQLASNAALDHAMSGWRGRLVHLLLGGLRTGRASPTR
jgi:pyruvate/2-oxoglutarate dehydrogenase complex dihydrolipoamide dehydrogenase (E3) component